MNSIQNHSSGVRIPVAYVARQYKEAKTPPITTGRLGFLERILKRPYVALRDLAAGELENLSKRFKIHLGNFVDILV